MVALTRPRVADPSLRGIAHRVDARLRDRLLIKTSDLFEKGSANCFKGLTRYYRTGNLFWQSLKISQVSHGFKIDSLNLFLMSIVRCSWSLYGVARGTSSYAFQFNISLDRSEESSGSFRLSYILDSKTWLRVILLLRDHEGRNYSPHWEEQILRSPRKTPGETACPHVGAVSFNHQQCPYGIP